MLKCRYKKTGGSPARRRIGKARGDVPETPRSGLRDGCENGGFPDTARAKFSLHSGSESVSQTVSATVHSGPSGDPLGSSAPSRFSMRRPLANIPRFSYIGILTLVFVNNFLNQFSEDFAPPPVLGPCRIPLRQLFFRSEKNGLATLPPRSPRSTTNEFSRPKFHGRRDFIFFFRRQPGLRRNPKSENSMGDRVGNDEKNVKNPDGLETGNRVFNPDVLPFRKQEEKLREMKTTKIAQRPDGLETGNTP